MILSKKALFYIIVALFVALTSSIFFNGFMISDLLDSVVVCGDLDARIEYHIDRFQ